LSSTVAPFSALSSGITAPQQKKIKFITTLVDANIVPLEMEIEVTYDREEDLQKTITKLLVQISSVGYTFGHPDREGGLVHYPPAQIKKISVSIPKVSIVHGAVNL
jgi:hypothetical protein